MKLGSLFDGSGGFPLAGAMNGITPIWASEIEPYPIAVTRSRFPTMKHYGNVCDINGAEVEPVDIITAGSPCQDLSVAGLRAGIYQGKRSNLFFESIRIVKEMREATNGEYPKYAVWENVPGAFSSNKGYDFHAVLEALCSVCDSTVSIPKPYDAKRANQLVWSGAGEIVGDNYSIAWRTLDAQYWGVPQRRKRIYLVADFGGQRAGEILFKPDSLRGNITQSNETGQGSSADAVGSVDGSVGVECIAWTYRGREGGCNVEFQDELAYAVRNPVGGGSIANVCYDARGNGDGETACTITGDHQNRITDYTAVACFQNTGRGWWNESETAATVRTACGGDSVKANLVAEKKRRYIIRRLTPTECARLQGFPDFWGHLAPYNPADAEFWEEVRKTHAEINGKKYKPTKNLKKWYEGLHTDSAEYKMWGNGIALPCAEYVIRGIASVMMEQEATPCAL